MTTHRVARQFIGAARFAAAAMCALGAIIGPACASAASPVAPQERVMPPDKTARTAAQQKINSRLLVEIERRRGNVPSGTLPAPDPGIKIDEKGRALVDVRVDVTPAIRKTIVDLGSTIVSESVEYHSIVAWIPLLKLEKLAEDPAVRAIVPPSGAVTNKG
jgi:hypothetical protein